MEAYEVLPDPENARLISLGSRSVREVFLVVLVASIGFQPVRQF